MLSTCGEHPESEKSDARGRAHNRYCLVRDHPASWVEEYLTMPATQIAGRDLEFTAMGFLVDFDHWDKEVAEALASRDNIILSECHWTVIDFLRGYYREFEHSPSPRIIIKDIGAQLTTNAPCTRRILEQLFPGGGCKQACRIAGLPDYYCHSC